MKLMGRFKGCVIRYNTEKGYGFISVTDEKIDENDYQKVLPKLDDAFIHYKDIEPEKRGLKKLLQGQIVEFDVYRNEKGLKAKELIILSSEYDDFGEINGNKFY